MKKLFLTSILLGIYAALFAQSAAPQQKLPALAESFNQQFNLGDSTAYKSYIKSLSNSPLNLNSEIRQYNQEYSFIGQTTVQKVNVVSATEVDAVLKTVRYGSWWQLIIITDSAQRYKEHHMRPMRLNDDLLQSGKLPQAQIITEIDKYIQNLVNQQVFAGNVFIAQHQKVLYNKSFGNNPEGMPNTYNQRFNLASMGKLFTTISILQLIDQKKLSLDDSLVHLLPQLNNAALHSITIRQLLTHTSGLGDYFENLEFDKMQEQIKTNADFLPLVQKDTLLFKPGTGFRYSNTGFIVLGMVVEQCSGVPYKTYLQKHIFEPLHMQSTVADFGAGGSTSTIDDMYKFALALQGGKLLKPETNKMLLNYQSKDGWGLGVEYQKLDNEQIIGHSGGYYKVCTELNIYLRNDYVVIILSNMDPPIGHYTSDKLKELIVRR